MAKLSELVNVDINRNTIQIQGVEIPVIFTFKSFPYVEEAYGTSYEKFEQDMLRMMEKGKIVLGKKEIKLMNALIYAMVRGGGTDCTISEIENAIPLGDLPAIFQVAINLFNNQNFQKSDMEKLKTEKKN
jgi:hypothetical protein